MADDLDPRVFVIEGEGPSPEFVANLRQRVLVELAECGLGASEHRDDDARDAVITVDLETHEAAEGPTRTPRLLVGAVAASVALVVGLVASTGIGDQTETETVTVPAESTTTTELSDQDLSTTIGPGAFAVDAERVEWESRALGAGTYRVDTVGTPFSFVIDERRYIQENYTALVALTHLDSGGPGDRDIVFTRLTEFLDPARPDVQLTGLGQGWPADDFDGWLDNVSDALVATNRTETTLGGRTAIRVDLEVDESACARGADFCVSFFTNGLTAPVSLRIGAKYRVWVVDQDDEDPLTVIVGVSRESQSDWFDVADGILSTVSFGDVGANPVLREPAGLVDLSLFDGVRVELVAEKTLSYEATNYVRILHDDLQADTEFLENPLDLAGVVIQSTDELVAVLEESSIQVTELESVIVGGFEARVFGIVDGAPGPALLWNLDNEPGWRPPVQGRLWLVEHPERGLLMVNAEAYGDVQSAFPIIVAETEQMLASLAFIDLG